MRYFIPIILFIVFIVACHKNNDALLATQASLKGNWRVIAERSGPDTLNTQAKWVDVNYTKQTGDYDIYCITDSRIGQSFLSSTNCTYQDAPGSYIGVFSADCAKSVFMRDTVWSQLVNYDFSLNESNQFNYLLQYNHSKRVNLMNQHCNTVIYTPAYSAKTEQAGTWSFNETDQIITVDYGTATSPVDGQKMNHYKVINFKNDEVVLRFQGSSLSDFKLHKL